MTAYLKAVAKAAPHLVRVFSIGKSLEGRPLLVAEVTNRNLKQGKEKPGLWVDGGHQGWNLLGTMACLELLRFLVSGHGRDEFLTDLVDHNAFYLAPRLVPDQMELCLAHGALVPQPCEATVAVQPQPRQFRQENPLGGWKPFKRDSRILVPRNPEDRGGPFYDLYRHLDSSRVQALAPNDFPSLTTKDSAQMLLRLASSRAVFEFLRSYPNVFGAISTTGPGERLQVVVDQAHRERFLSLGHRLGELAGLPCTTVEPNIRGGGGFLSWTFQALGIVSLDCQLWSLPKAAGVTDPEPLDPFELEETQWLQLLRFCESEFPEHGFADWQTAEEAGFGSGERGGWDWSTSWLNPPPGPYLSRELKRFSRLALGLAAAGPRLVVAQAQEKVVGWTPGESGSPEPLRQVKVRVENRGYLPTNPLGKAPGSGAHLRVRISKGATERLIGEADSALGELQGLGYFEVEDGWHREPGFGSDLPHRAVEKEFLFQGTSEVEFEVFHPLAGMDRMSSRPSAHLRPPSFSGEAPRRASAVEEEELPVEADAFEDVFPSFEELYPGPEQGKDLGGPPPNVPPKPTSQPIPEAPPKRVQPAARPKPEFSEFDIPLPPDPGDVRRPPKVEFPTLGGEDSEARRSSAGPFPAAKPVKGRVFGSPPQKPTGGLPLGVNRDLAVDPPASRPKESAPSVSSSTDSDFSPLPLVKATGKTFESRRPQPPVDPNASSEEIFDSEDTFQPMLPTAAKSVSAETRILPPDEESERPSAPPARLSRMSAPQLLRRQRGTKGQGDAFPR